MEDLRQLYQQLILEHAKAPKGKTAQLAGPDGGMGLVIGTSHQTNPTCGDDINLTVALADGRIAEIAWQGQGCSISQASASVMTELLTGAELAVVARDEDLFHQLMASKGKGLASDDDLDELGDAIAFTGVSQYPARIKCALLGWAALKGALANADSGNDGRT